VLGPHYNSTQDLLSIYVGQNIIVNSYSPLQGIVDVGANVIGSAMGCDLFTNDTSGFAEAVAIAQQADYAIVFIGLHPGQGGGSAREDEGWDRENVTVPGVQTELVQAIAATRVPTIVVMINGGPIAITWIKENIPGIIEAWYPGEIGGLAIANVLFGIVSPAGRLPITLYDVNIDWQRPTIMDMSLRNRGGITYRYYTGKPLWPFGWGLSYTTFSFQWSRVATDADGDLKTTTPDDVSQHRAHVRATTAAMLAAHPRYYQTRGRLTADDTPALYQVTVKNTGQVTSDCVVLGFITSTHQDAPLRELFGYDRVTLVPGNSTTIYFSVPPQVLSLVNALGEEYIRAGNYTIQIGDSLSHVEGTLELTGEDLLLFSLPDARRKAAARAEARLEGQQKLAGAAASAAASRE